MKFNSESIHEYNDLLLLSPASHKLIHPTLLLNGVIASVLWQGHQKYEIMWDTSSLTFQLEKSMKNENLMTQELLC